VGPVTLTDDEKQAGRMFRAHRQGLLDDLNAARPPHGAALAVWRVVRHECAARGGASVGITLREHRAASPEYRVCYCGAVGATSAEFPHYDCDGSKVLAADGLFTWIWREGGCAGCGRVVRSSTGRFAVAADRPAGNGRADVERRQAGPHPGDT
jgi:hypothetical protein